MRHIRERLRHWIGTITARLREWPTARVPAGQGSLVNRLLLLLLLGSVFIYLIAIVGLWAITSHLISDGVRRQAAQWVVEMQELGTPLYASRAHRAMPHIENRIRNFPEVAFIRYYDAAGDLLRAFGDDSDTRPLDPLLVERLKAIAKSDRPYLYREDVRGRYAHLLAPVRIRSIRTDGLFNLDLERRQAENVKVIGYIDVGIDLGFYRAQLTRSLVIGGLIIAAVFGFALFIGRRLITRALTPLTELQVPLARLARGETDVRVDTAGDRELVAIGDALNATISALQARDETLRRVAERDPLTGLYNRGSFTVLLEREIQNVSARGSTSGLLFIDLDRFKSINDTLGHAAGDRLLVQIADLIEGRLREGDVVARFGGDEFTVITRNVSRNGVVDVARAINGIMREYYFSEGGQRFNIGCSIGITMIAPDAGDAEELLIQADAACFEAKAAGRNRYQMYEAGQDDVNRTAADISWSQLIKQSLSEGSFRLVYQPIASIGDAPCQCYEVLLRLPKDGELIGPNAFLSVAERFGLLGEIDHWVIRQAIAALAAWRTASQPAIFFINLSSQTFEDPAMPVVVEEALREYQVPGSACVFEITEQTAVRHLDKVRRMMSRLSDLGCRFALDDFGVGFSSFNYLKHLPLDYIKIDGCFIENIVNEPVDQAMVRAITQIAKALGKRVIAESVQDDATVQLLKGYGVDYVQGYYIGRPARLLAPPVFRGATRRALAQTGS